VPVPVPDLTDDALTDEVDSNEETLWTPLPDPVGVGAPPTEEAKAAAVDPPTYPYGPITLLVAESLRSRPRGVGTGVG
jgi:hypothetical protein